MFLRNTNKRVPQRQKFIPESVYRLWLASRNTLFLLARMTQQAYNTVYREMMPPCMSKHHSDATRNATTPFLYEVAYTTSKQDNGGAEHTMMNGMYEDDGESVTICNSYRNLDRHGIQEAVGSIPSSSTIYSRNRGHFGIPKAASYFFQSRALSLGSKR